MAVEEGRGARLVLRPRAASRWRRRAAPPGFTRAAASSRIPSCSGGKAAISAGVTRHLPSGLRRQAPVPEQGASTSTRSQTGPARRARAVEDAHRRRRRGAARSGRSAMRRGLTSQASSRPAPLHRGGEGQRLAAAAGAVVEHRHARSGPGERGDELARHVLQLDHALAVGAAGGDRPRVLDHAQRVRGQRMRRGPHAVAGEHDGRGVGGGLQRVHAQVDRRARLHRGQHRLEVRAERRAQARRRGNRDSRGAPGPAGGVGRRREARAFVGASAAPGRSPRRCRARRGRRRPRPACASTIARPVSAPPRQAERAAPAQPVEDEVAHRRAVLRAGEPARPRPARQRPLGGFAGDRGVEQLDGGGEAGGGGHRAGMCSQTPRCASGGTIGAPTR